MLFCHFEEQKIYTKGMNKKWCFNKICVSILIITVITTNILFVLFLFFNLTIQVTNMENFGSIGSLIGGIATALAFFSVIYFNKKQNKSAKIISFENTLFKMVSLQLEIVNGLEYATKEEKTKKGREVFKYLFEEEDTTDISPDLPDKGMRQILDRHSLQDYEKVKYIGTFDHYFRNLYRIVKFIDEQENKLLSHKNKYDYIANNVRSMLSKYELIWLYYNCLNEIGNRKFKPLIEKYTLFKNLREIELANSSRSRKYEYRFYADIDNEEENPLEENPLEENLPFPQNEYEYYINIDDQNESKLDKYKLQAFHNKKEDITKWQQYYLDIRDNGLTREKAWQKHFV